MTTVNPDVEAVLAAQAKEYEGIELRVPILKVCQPLTKEVSAHDAEPGDFLNTLTGLSLGDKIGFIPAFFQKGRSLAVKDGPHKGRYFVSIAQDTIPEQWADGLGEEWVGQPFTEHPQSEERYKEWVNADEKNEWGSGPKISTTYNYTGLALVSVLLDDDDEEIVSLQPGRITFQRSTKKAHDKINSITRSILRAPWDMVFDLSTKEETFGRNVSHIVVVKMGRETTALEKAKASELAVNVMRGVVADNSEEANAPVEREKVAEPEGALGVG